MNTSNYYLQLKENIQSLTLATINLDKKYEEKFKKLSDSIDIENAQEILVEIKEYVETTNKQLEELDTIIKNYTNVPEDIEKLKDKDSDLQKQIKKNADDISTNKTAIGNNTSSINDIKNDIYDDTNGINVTIAGINQSLATDEVIIGSLQTQVSSNKSNIESLQSTVKDNSADIESLQTEVKDNSADIKSLQNDMNSKAETDDVYTKTKIDELLGGFYKIYNPITTNDFNSNTSNITLAPISLTKLLKYPISLPSLSINNLQFVNMEISGNIIYNSSSLDFETSNFMAVSFAGNIFPLPAIVSSKIYLVSGNNYEITISFHGNYNFSYDFTGSIEIMFFNINSYSISLTNVRNHIHIKRYGYYL